MSTQPRRRAARPRNSGSRFFAVVLVLLALAGITTIALGIMGAGSTPTYTQAPVIDKPFAPGDADTYTGPTDPPSTTRSTTTKTAGNTGPLGPLELSVPSVGLRASIVDGGLTTKGTIDLPTSPLVAHYSPAAALGATTGSTVIAGHVDMFSGTKLVPSPMALLAKIQKGAPIFVTDAAGTIHRYKAVDARLYAKHALPEALFTKTGAPQLVLITCGGDIGEIDGQINFLSNTVISAIPWA